jgi:hypothetical protein
VVVWPFAASVWAGAILELAKLRIARFGLRREFDRRIAELGRWSYAGDAAAVEEARARARETAAAVDESRAREARIRADARARVAERRRGA